jgi:serine/threonine protein kinase
MHPTFGRYELLKRLAGGGMGEVYLARQSGLDGFQKLLVIKTLLPHLCEDEEFITMFKDEARVTAQLIHPNICQVFEFDQVGGVYYMCMEYLRGEDLRRLWKACEARGTPLRVPLICRIIADAASGLDFAHRLRDAKGEPYHIVHRDISPQNILVTFEGGVKIIDFGVAKAAGRAQHTRTGALKGKCGYMSPEQAAGANLDGRSDIFALGIVLHELLTGGRLFKADSDVQTLARVRECQVPPPSRLNPQLPPGLDPIVLKALAKDPDERYRTAQEFRLELEDWFVRGSMSASSAHLAEFLKLIYSPDSPVTPSGNTPATVGGAVVDPSRAPLNYATPFKGRNTMRVSVAVVAVGILATAFFALRSPGKPAVLPEPKPAAGYQPRKAGPETHTVTIAIEPAGTEIFEGSRLIGRSPKVWSGAPAGEHALTFQRDGYLDEQGMIVVAKDGDEFSFKPLRKIETKKSVPELSIKAER